jgi:hypothetical protein
MKSFGCPGRSRAAGNVESGKGGPGRAPELSHSSLSLSASQGTRQGEALSVLLAKSTQLPGLKQGRGR